MTAVFHLAQVNIARMRGSYEDPVMEGFVAQLDTINQLADESDGFVWRLQTEDGDATALRVFEDELILINLSVWESVEALGAFVYQSLHRNLIRDRSSWFVPMEGAHLALWWVEAGHLPTEAEARQRLDALNQDGPTPFAFTFAKRFDSPAKAGSQSHA